MCTKVTFFLIVLHVIEEYCKHAENASGHTSKEEQLYIEEASNKPTNCPPLSVCLCSGWWCAQAQSDGQSICNRVDLHMDR